MGDPFHDPERILYLLNHPICPDNLGKVQGGCTQTLMDCWDREVTRDEFVDMVVPILTLNASCAKLWMLDKIIAPYREGKLTDEVFQAAIDGLTQMVGENVAACVKIVTRVAECPTSEDVIH